MDDILSALDANVGAKIMKETILGVLRGKTIIMVTHALQYLKHSDFVYLMDEGQFFLQGSFDSVADSELYRKFTQLEEWTTEQLKKEEKDEEEIKKEIFSIRKISLKKEISNQNSEQKEEENHLVAELNLPEDRQQGVVSFKVLALFIKEMGGFHLLLVPFTLNLIMNFSLMFSVNYFQKWSYEFDPENKYSDLIKYSVILMSGSSLESIGSLFLNSLSYGMSLRVHNKMIYRILHAKIEEFLNKIPSGRIMNRFSKDISSVDKELSDKLSWLVFLIAQILVTFGTIGYALGWEVFILIFIMVFACVRLQYRYQKARREYQRLESISRSPILNTSSDTVKGLPSIRNMSLQRFMRKKFEDGVDGNAKNALTSACLRNWFDLRLGLSGILLVHLPCYLMMLFYFTDLTVPKAGLFLVSIYSLCQIFEDLINQVAEVEICLISLERCLAFQEVDIEEQYTQYEDEFKKLMKAGRNPQKVVKEIEKKRKEKKIIIKGKVEFENVFARYTTSSNYVLKGLNFCINSAEKVGVVGRTGSGKSSLIKVLWRCLHYSKGKILIDGHEITKVELKTLRSQMMVVTQEAALFQGTLKENLHPDIDMPEQKYLKILEELEFSHDEFISKGLQMQVDAGGSNLSEGEKQLVCFARCLIDPPKLIILDEATASIDLKTEELIQNCISKYFCQSTMLVIAHRVQTVMECDRIIVLKDGEIEAMDTPGNLMNGDSFFKEIVEKMKSEEH